MGLAVLNSLELTGRAASHIVEVPALAARLHRDAAGPAMALRAAAAAAGIDLAFVSTFRDFARQSAIWNGKFRGERGHLHDVAGGASGELERIKHGEAHFPGILDCRRP